MVFDGITLIVCLALLLLAAVSVLSDLFFRKVDTAGGGAEGNVYRPVSVVIVADNNARELEESLSSFLSQDYPAGFEVIVVVAKDDDGTADVLKKYSGNPSFYSTFVPTSSRYMSRRKLAITLGVKAAKNEWILLTDATCRPVSDRWIHSMASACRDGVDMVLGYSNYPVSAGHFKPFCRFRREYSLFVEAAGGTAYGIAGNNLMFRKDMFMSGDGFLGNLKYLRGEYEFLVNKYAVRGNVAVVTDEDGHLSDSASSKKMWHSRCVFYAETRRHLARSFGHRWRFLADTLSLYLCLCASVASAVFSVLSAHWLVLPFSCVALVVPFVMRTMFAKRAMAVFGLHVPLWKVVPFELSMVWHSLKYLIIYKFSDKYDFISHKS